MPAVSSTTPQDTILRWWDILKKSYAIRLVFWFF